MLQSGMNFVKNENNTRETTETRRNTEAVIGSKTKEVMKKEGKAYEKRDDGE